MSGGSLMLKDARPARLAKPVSFFTRVARQGRNYSHLLGWLLYSAFKGRAAKLAIAVVLSLVHLASQAAAIYAVFWYGRQMEQTGLASVPFLNIHVNLKEQPEWLWVIVIFSTACFVVSAGFLYLSRQQILDIVEKHYARNVEELVLLSLRLPDPRVRLATNLFRQFGVGGLGMGCRRGAITAIGFANAITAVVGGIGSAIFLFWVDHTLTLLILVSVGLATLLLYPLTLRAVQSAKDREKVQAAFKMEVRQLAEQRSIEQTAKSLETADELARAYMMRRRVLTELVFAIEIGITVILGLVIYYLANEALAGRQEWAIFISYVAALRMTLSGASQPIRAFASVSRYYPQIVRYHLFIKDMQRIDAVPLAQVQRGDRLILGTLPNGEDVVVEAGDCIALVTIDPMRELQFALLDARVPHSSAPLVTAIVDPAYVSASDAAVVLIGYFGLDKDGEQIRTLREGALKDKVTLIVYRHTEKPGAFGEKRVLTAIDGELRRFVSLGTEDGDAAIKEVSLKVAAMRRKKRGLGDSDEEEDEDDDI